MDKRADRVQALKGNQGSLNEDVALFASEQQVAGFTNPKISRDRTVDGDRGRIKTQSTADTSPWSLVRAVGVTWIQAAKGICPCCT